MKENIYIVSGGKGGTGKSMVSIALMDYLTEKLHKKVFLVESDTSNPDVGRVFLKHVDGVQRFPGAALDLDKVEGWVKLVDAAEEYKDHVLVVNSAARNSDGVEKSAKMLEKSLSGLERKLTTLWVINTQRDSLELCRKYIDMVPFGTLHIVRNEYFGRTEKFNLYEGSNLRPVVETHGKTLDFPCLGDNVCDVMRNNNLSPAELKEGNYLKMGSRTVLRMWREDCADMFKQVID